MRTATMDYARAATRSDHPRTAVEVRGLHKTFRRGGGALVSAISDVSFDLHPGELLVLLGPSGCGKTTLLRSIAGFEEPDSGSISINGRVMFDASSEVNVPPERRGVSMLFQSYALWPHMVVEDNIAYPLRAQKVPKQRRASLIDRVLSMGGIAELRNQYPDQLSGGQQQRVALARSLVADPTVVLFDEPLSNIDEKVRQQLRVEMRRLQREIGFAGIYVTHDQQEAMEMADTLVVMHEGAMAQVGTPRELYNNPASAYIANFIGTTNELLGEVGGQTEDSLVTVATNIGAVRVVADRAKRLPASGTARVMFRPEAVKVTPPVSNATPNTWLGIVEDVVFRGTHGEAFVAVQDAVIRCLVEPDADVRAGVEVSLSVSPDRCMAFPQSERAHAYAEEPESSEGGPQAQPSGKDRPA